VKKATAKAVAKKIAKTVVKRARPRMPRISDEMTQWSATLEDELRDWPAVTLRPMFGMIAVYRGDQIFAALPRTRAMRNANAISLRFDPLPPTLARRAERDPRLQLDEQAAMSIRWHTFELSTDDDLRDALTWLSAAYEAARTAKRAPATHTASKREVTSRARTTTKATKLV
jgi:hypothetical protein